VKQIREKQKRPKFYDFEQYDRLVLAAEAQSVSRGEAA
jgi:hypothetical protein